MSTSVRASTLKTSSIRLLHAWSRGPRLAIGWTERHEGCTLIIAVTLLRDALPNVRRFVDANLAAGMDHLVVVLDGASPNVETYLNAQSRVTAIVADLKWWGSERVESLNGRQRVVANLVREACADVGYVDWLFFIDGDEIALPDRAVLAGVPDEFSAVRLWPLESVAGGEGLLFKRLLTRPELRHLTRLGLIEKANNARYFHGHVSGKVGVRPSAGTYLGVHAAEEEDGAKAPTFEHHALRHLHFESPTFEEFVRKWTALAASGPPPGMRDRRASVLNAFITLESEPDPLVRSQVARELYEGYVVEDVDGLEAAGVLERVDVSTLSEPSTPLTREQCAALEAAINRQSQRPRKEFLPVRHGGVASASRR
jgi:hypothetical protein